MSLIVALLTIQAAEQPLFVPTPLPKEGIYSFECAMARDDFSLERMTGTYTLASPGADTIAFDQSSETVELAGKAIQFSYYDVNRQSEGGVQEGGVWTWIQLPGSLPIAGEEFTFKLYQDDYGPKQPGTIPGSLVGAAICRRSSETVPA